MRSIERGSIIVEKFKTYYLQYRHAIPLILYGIFYLTWFAHLEQTVTTQYKEIHMAIDDYIPFCELFVVPYFLWFVYVAAVVMFFFFKDKDDYYKTCMFLFTGMTIFLIVSSLWPNGHHLRPYAMPRDNFFTRWIAHLYEIDTATNLWPSIHVYNSLGAHFAIIKSKHFADRKGIKIGSFILSSSIILSTMLIKQHSVFDVITAFILATVMYVVVYRTDIVAAFRQRVRSEEKKRPQIS